MKYFSLYRISTYLLLLFCFGHTVGGLLSNKSLGPQADAVLASMKSVHFNFNGADCTWYGFHLGFGLMVSVFLLFCAFITWYLGGLGPDESRACLPIAWALVASQILTAVLSWSYFFAGPATLSTLVAILVAIQSFRQQSAELVRA
jgi:hypothetical protein